jgi:FlaA1/EpsC-like NDP-sugar epimerase
MGTPVRIVDLARDLITLSGLRPGIDIEVLFTSVRPGEKLHEELACAQESAEKTRHPRIYVGRGSGLMPFAAVAGVVDQLRAWAAENDVRALLAGLSRLVPQFQAGAVSQACAEQQSATPPELVTDVPPVQAPRAVHGDTG